jgi:hypothetical protein
MKERKGGYMVWLEDRGEPEGPESCLTYGGV